MKFFKKLKSGNFWISLISAGVLIAEGIFDFEIKTEYLNQILLGLMGILTLFGIVTDHGDTSVILNTTTSTQTESQEEKAESPSNVSNIKSICDTVSLLLNKVSINSNLDMENVTDIINEVKEINEALHKENEKVEENCKAETEIVPEKVVENKKEEVRQEVVFQPKVEEKQEVLEEEKEEVNLVPVEEIKVEVPEVEENIKIEEEPQAEQVENAIINPIENEIQEISIVNN